VFCQEQSEAACKDGKDNDKDGYIDCDDTNCKATVTCGGGSSGAGGTGSTIQDEVTFALCTDGLDNDHNGFADCADNSCRDLFSICQEKTDAACKDGKDNDQDGYIDCADSSCKGKAPCLENTAAACSDGKDNDGDGFIDCNDFDCQNKPAIQNCYVPPQSCTDSYEPNNQASASTLLYVQQGAGEQCKQFTICATDTDHIRVYFTNASSPGPFSLRITLLSPPGASTTIATSVDNSNKETTQSQYLVSGHTEGSLTQSGAIVCSDGACPEVQRKLTITSNSPVGLTYKICGQLP
jgi:hypothetical protein